MAHQNGAYNRTSETSLLFERHRASWFSKVGRRATH
jgi:hypothetical protein